MHDRREPSVEREHASPARDVQPSAAPDAAVAISTDESDEWLVSETYSDTDVSIRPRLHSHLSYRSGPELPGYGDDPVAMRAHQAIDDAVAEFIGYSERASLAPTTTTPRHTPVGLPPQRALPEAPQPRRPTPIQSAPAQRHGTQPPTRVTPAATWSRPTPSELPPAPRRSTPPPVPPSAATGRHAPIPHIETTPHGILPRPAQPRRSTPPPPLPPSAASGRHTPASGQPYGILPAYTQTQAPRKSTPPQELQVAQPPQPELSRTGRHPTPQPEPTGRHATPGARRPTPAQGLPPNPPLPPTPAPRRNTPMPAPPRASVSPQQAAAETQPLPSTSPRHTPSEPLPGATPPQGIPEQFQEQLLRALQRAHDSDVRSVAAERRAILAESAARAAAMSANVTQPIPRPALRGRAGRALLWGAVCFSLGGYVALLVPIRERMLEQAAALRDLGRRQTQALEAQRQYYQGEHERLERQNAELERQLQSSTEAAKLTAAATTRAR